VITSTMTFTASAATVIHAGARLVLVDARGHQLDRPTSPARSRRARVLVLMQFADIRG
jgi:hypothetical protein